MACEDGDHKPIPSTIEWTGEDLIGECKNCGKSIIVGQDFQYDASWFEY